MKRARVRIPWSRPTVAADSRIMAGLANRSVVIESPRFFGIFTKRVLKILSVAACIWSIFACNTFLYCGNKQ